MVKGRRLRQIRIARLAEPHRQGRRQEVGMNQCAAFALLRERRVRQLRAAVVEVGHLEAQVVRGGEREAHDALDFAQRRLGFPPEQQRAPERGGAPGEVREIRRAAAAHALHVPPRAFNRRRRGRTARRRRGCRSVARGVVDVRRFVRIFQGPFVGDFDHLKAPALARDVAVQGGHGGDLVGGEDGGACHSGNAGQERRFHVLQHDDFVPVQKLLRPPRNRRPDHEHVWAASREFGDEDFRVTVLLLQ
mmetsp:Transcript_14894/g.51179  ORF Transcript_14894/g.51179 Transcript_14894/m.51179 type:complete len:248 (+) Transcript_14894:1202-1945(+)